MRLRSAAVHGMTVIVSGKILRMASIHDAEFIEAGLGHYVDEFIRDVAATGLNADILAFADPILPEAQQRQRAFEWDNAAVADTTSFDAWWTASPQEARKNVRRAAKRGVSVDVTSFDDALVRGIKAIYDETPVRQGRRFWHFQKPLERVAAENATYLDRSEFIGAVL